MRNVLTATAVSLLLISLSPQAASAAPTKGEALLQTMSDCRPLSDAERLKCYDRAVGDLLSAKDQHEIRIVDREAMVRTKRSLFGFSLPNIDLLGDGKNDGTDVREITATITKIGEVQSGEWTFAVGDGGVWQTTSAPMSFGPRVGDTVTIKAGILGHYTARIKGWRVVDVKRVR